MEGINVDYLLDIIQSVKIHMSREYEAFDSSEMSAVEECVYGALDDLCVRAEKEHDRTWI